MEKCKSHFLQTTPHLAKSLERIIPMLSLQQWGTATVSPKYIFKLI